jgi:hypothetical protein
MGMNEIVRRKKKLKKKKLKKNPPRFKKTKIFRVLGGIIALSRTDNKNYCRITHHIVSKERIKENCETI